MQRFPRSPPRSAAWISWFTVRPRFFRGAFSSSRLRISTEPSRSIFSEPPTSFALRRPSTIGTVVMLKGNPMLAVKILWNMLLRLSANLRSTSQRVADLQAQTNITDP